MATQTLQTTNFNINFDTAVLPNSDKRANALLSVCESEFTALCGWFGVSGGFGTNNRITVNVTGADNSGASNRGYAADGSTAITVDAQNGNKNDANAAEIVRMVFVAELVEILMDYRNTQGPATWNRGDSSGEGLSQLCALLRFTHGHNLYYPPWVNTWLQLPDRDAASHDWISKSEGTDSNAESFGCALLFLFYLRNQLGYSVEDIIQEAGNTLELTYQNLTGKTGAFGAFTGLLDPVFPVGSTPALLTNNPFPLLNAARREVYINTTSTPVREAYAVRAGIAEVQPFFLCPKKYYQYEIDSTPQELTCVATTKGFGQPVFRWRINGVDVPASGIPVSTTAMVFIDDPTAPNYGAKSVIPVPVTCAITDATFNSTLKATFPSTVGHIDLVIEAFANERFVPVSPELETVGTDWITVDNEQLVWEQKYYDDRNACKDRFMDIVNSYVRANPFFEILRTLPDPPEEFGQVLRQLGQLSIAIKGLERTEPEDARAVEQAVEYTLGVSAQVLHEIGAQSSV